MILGIDCASKLTFDKAKALKNKGYEFAGRYLVPQTGNLKWKALTAQEAKDITDAGMSLLTVYETTANRALGGAASGAYDGAQALKCAHDISMPTSGVIYFAVDFGAQAGDMDTIEAYLKAARLNTDEYEIGVYGSYFVVEEMAKRKACIHFWQCVGWSQGKKSSYRNVYQAKWNKTEAGVAVDINECDDMGAAGIWNYEEDNMTGKQIYEKLNEYLANEQAPDWAKKELNEAIQMGITDGERPMQLVPRYQAAIMAKRALQKAITNE